MPFTIPTIDIAPYVADPGSAAAAKVVSDVRQACTTTGFFSMVGHTVPRALQDALVRAAQQLFALPLETKKQLRPPTTTSVLLNRGYELIGAQALQEGEGAQPDLKEGYFIGQHIPSTDARARRHPQLLGENIFPRDSDLPPAVLREPAEAYYAAVLALANTVLEILAKGLPYGDDVFDEFRGNNPLCNLRLLHYPPQAAAAADDQLGAGAHTDFGAVTLLYQDGAGGLEVLDEATGTWVGVAPNPDAYVVNIGDMLSMWTRGAYKSNVHRVINRSRTTDRYSLPFFFDGNLDTKLAPLDGSRPLSGEVITAEEHMLRRLGQTYGRGRPTAAAAAAAASS